MSKQATILCVKAADVELIPIGATRTCDLPTMVVPRAWAGPRDVLETDPTFLQIIPYVLVKKGGLYLSYVRTTAGGEDRLHGKASIGLGGHIDAQDFLLADNGSIDIDRTSRNGAHRELLEELNIYSLQSDFELIGYVQWDVTPVDKVHLGLVFLFDLDKHARNEPVTIAQLRGEAEDALGDLQFMSVEELRETTLELETWTRLALDLL